MKHYTVTLKNDDEGMFGGIDSSEMDKIDVEATIEAYEKYVTALADKKLPECEIVHEYGPYAGKSIFVTDNEVDGYADDADVEWIEAVLSDVVENVFGEGAFWTTLEETDTRRNAAAALRAIPSAKRSQASRENGRKGGRPRKYHSDKLGEVTIPED